MDQSKAEDVWTLWGRWFLGDPFKRTLSPFSKITVAEYIEAKIQEDTPKSLAEAEALALGNTNFLQHIFQARSALDRTK